MREFLKGLELDKELIDTIMAEHGKHMTANKERADGLQKQLEDAAKEIKSFKDLDIDGIKKAASDWESKYSTETQALKDQLAEQSYGFAVQQSVSGINFTSEGAKKAFIADLTAKKLTLQDGKLLGLEDFRKEYETSDPGTFASEETPPPYAPSAGSNPMLHGGKPFSVESSAKLNEHRLIK